MQKVQKVATSVLLALFALPLVLASDAVPIADNPSTGQYPIPAEELQAFGQAYRLILEHHPGEFTPQQLMRAALQGMASQLDAHSHYQPAADDGKSTEPAFGTVSDIGVNLALSSQGVVITTVLPASAAQRAGVRPGDLLRALDERSLVGTSIADIRQQLGGEVGSTLRLTVERGRQTHTIPLERIAYDTREVTSELLQNQYGLIRIREFSPQTPTQFEKKMSGLIKAAKGLKGLVIDVRGNPGGQIEAAIAVADHFLEEGPVIVVERRDKLQRQLFSTHSGDDLRGTPVAVLVDQDTASSAEILALVLQQGKRAAVVGTRTRGKGSVQSVFPLGNGRTLTLTTGYYQDMQGNNIQHTGVEPDFRVVFPNVSGARASDADALAHEDYALFEAVNVLSTLNRLSP